MPTDYINLDELNVFHMEIMRFIALWVREHKTPVPQKEIILVMGKAGKHPKPPTVVWALNSLLEKGYIRRACIVSNKTYYVLLRTVV
jgi:Fe2+ or Zn2+ uptake regulation protein